MSEYDKYICTELKKRHLLPGPTPEERDRLAAEGLRIRMEHVLWIDNDVLPGSYYGESTWIWPQSYPNQITPDELAKRTTATNPMFPHVHDFPELLSWWGTDPDHPEDTSAMGMLIGEEEIPLEKSWVAYIPAHVKHMPTRKPGARVSQNPVCHWTSGPGFYNRDEDREKKDTPSHDAREAGAGPKPSSDPGQSNSRFVVYDYPANLKKPGFMRELDPRYARPMAYVDENVVPGAEFGCDTMWLLPGETSKSGMQIMDRHTLPYGTSFVLNTMNYDNITDLCAEAELWIGGEKHIINKSFGAYVPPNVEQGPLILRNVTKQIFFLMSHPVGEGIRKYRGG